MQPIILDLESVSIGDADTYLEPGKAPDNYKDPEKIAAYIADARTKQLEMAAVDVDLARIIAIGINYDGHTHVLTEEHYGEAEMLTEVWERWRHYVKTGSPMLVTYGGLNFDVPLLMRRSLYLGVQAPYISCDRFRHPQQIDLMAVLSMDGKLKWRGLQFYLNRFGYTGGGPDITGADIGAAYAAGDWAAIAQHCRMDVDGTAWLAERIGAVPKRQPVPEAAGAF